MTKKEDLQLIFYKPYLFSIRLREGMKIIKMKKIKIKKKDKRKDKKRLS
jgi:hypothetical protein